MTGLRFPAALFVFFNHLGLPFPQLRLLEDESTVMDFLDGTKNAGALGVAFFFVLSGFVLTWSVRPTDTARAFWRRRFVKIYPNYAITWALAMLLFAGAYTPWGTAVANLLLVHVWNPDMAVFSSVNTPSWSLACEAVFYACFPFLDLVFRRIRAAHLKYWITGTLAAVILTPWFTYAVLPDDPNFYGGEGLGARASEAQYWFAYFAPPTQLFNFVLGMLLARAVLAGRWKNIGILPSLGLLAVSYLLALEVPFLYAQRSMTIIPIALLIAAAATADVKGTASVFRTRLMIRLGEISFAFYLVHYIVLVEFRERLGTGFYSTTETIGLWICEFAIALALSWVLYTFVEHPLYRRYSRARRAEPVPER